MVQFPSLAGCGRLMPVDRPAPRRPPASRSDNTAAGIGDATVCTCLVITSAILIVIFQLVCAVRFEPAPVLLQVGCPRLGVRTSMNTPPLEWQTMGNSHRGL
jgi:hypothetical protein